MKDKVYIRGMTLYVRVIVFVFIMAVLSSILRQTLFRRPAETWSVRMSVGEPLVIHDDHEYFSLIDDVCASGQYVYLLYSEMHLVKVYDTERRYVCTVIVSDQQAHGSHAQMYVQNGHLYLQAGNDIYEFEDDRFIAFHRHQDNPSLLKELRHKNRTDHLQNRYFVRNGSVYLKDRDGNERVFLQRSIIYHLCSPLVPWVLWGVLVVLVIVPQAIRRGKGSGS